MVARNLTGLVLVLSTCLAAGTLACGHPSLTPTARHGEELYDRTCAVCHGRAGEGYAADQAPALAQADFLATVTDDYLRRAITLGRSGTTMSAWSTARGGPLAPVDVEAVIAFIRSWEHRPRAALDERPLTGNAARGAATYVRRCAQCHGSNGMNGTNLHIGNRDLLGTASNGFLRYAIQRGRSGTPMTSFARVLGDPGVEDVVALLRSWQTAHPPPSLTASPPMAPIPLGPLPLNPHGPEPIGFHMQPATTPADVIKAELDRGARMGLLDARAPADYANEHIAGAVSVPFYDPDPYFDGLPKNTWLVCYCACPHAESGQLAQKLVSHGFTKVTVLDEGLGTWRTRKYGTRAGTAP